MGPLTPFAGIEWAEVDLLGVGAVEEGVGLGNQEFHFGHITFEMLTSRPDGGAERAVK